MRAFGWPLRSDLGFHEHGLSLHPNGRNGCKVARVEAIARLCRIYDIFNDGELTPCLVSLSHTYIGPATFFPTTVGRPKLA